MDEKQYLREQLAAQQRVQSGSPRRSYEQRDGAMVTTNPAPEASPPSVASESQTFIIKST